MNRFFSLNFPLCVDAQVEVVALSSYEEKEEQFKEQVGHYTLEFFTPTPPTPQKKRTTTTHTNTHTHTHTHQGVNFCYQTINSEDGMHLYHNIINQNFETDFIGILLLYYTGGSSF